MESGSNKAEKTTHVKSTLPPIDALPGAYAALKSQFDQQLKILGKKDEAITARDARIAVLEELLQLNKVERFAASSESNPLQSALCFNEAEACADQAEADAKLEDKATKAADEAKPKAKKSGRKGLNPNIPRVQERHLLSDEQRKNAIETFFVTVKEELDITPATVRVIEHVQEKAIYLNDDGQRQVMAAARPDHPLGKCIASVALLSYIIIAKYCDGLPLYRLEGILARYGGSISRATMARWVIGLSTQLRPVVNLLKEVQLTTDYLQIDETRLKVLKEHGTVPTSDKWMWLVRGGPPDKPVVLFEYDKSRGAKVAKRLLDGFEGRYVQSDGYAAYDAAMAGTDVTQVGCMDHARRRFVKAIKALPAKAKKDVKSTPKCVVALSMIDALYRIEREMEKLSLTDEERRLYRERYAKPRLDKLHAWLTHNVSRVAKDTLTHDAISYMLKQWTKLIAYCDHGQLRISNVLAENSIRPYVVGRKAWLFSDTPSGAHASALYYTLIETAKANDLDPYRYINHLVSNIAAAETVEDIEALLPWNAKHLLDKAKVNNP